MMSYNPVFIVFAILLIAVHGNIDVLSAQEKLLIKFFGSNRRLAEVIPKKNLTDSIPLDVHFSYIISHIYDIRSNEEEVDLAIWITMLADFLSCYKFKPVQHQVSAREEELKIYEPSVRCIYEKRWTSQLVSWNVTEYPVERLEVQLEKMWIPKIFLVQNAMSQPLSPKNEMGIALVYPNGVTTVDFAALVKLSCSMPACLFPADEHTCPLIFNSITYQNNLLKLVYDHQIDKDYAQFAKHETGLWRILKNKVTELDFTSTAHSGKPGNSSALMTSLKFIRKPGYYWLTVIAPMVLICIVTFCSVLLPWESGERTSLLITCFLALIVYLDTILNSVPKTSDYVPVIVMFVIIVLVFTIVQITFTALASYFAERASKGKRLATPHRNVVELLSKIFCKSKKKKSNVNSFELSGYVDDEIEIERKFPPAVRRQDSQNGNGVERKVSNGRSGAGRKIYRSGSFTGIRDNIREETNSGEMDVSEISKEEIKSPCAGKECRKACKLIDRISMFLSFSLMIACPTFFHLMYSGKVPLDCGQYP